MLFVQYIKKNIKHFTKEMKNEDRKKEEKERAKRLAKREAMRRDFESMVAQRALDKQADFELRKELKIE